MHLRHDGQRSPVILWLKLAPKLHFRYSNLDFDKYRFLQSLKLLPAPASHNRAIAAEAAACSLLAPTAACLPGPGWRAALSLLLCKITSNLPDFALK